MFAYIYLYVFPDGRVYIGQTTDLERRHRLHLEGKWCGQFAGEAFLKYQPDLPQVLEIIPVSDVPLPKEEQSEVDSRERYFIAKYEATDRLKGHNRTTGGRLTWNITEELKEQITKNTREAFKRIPKEVLSDRSKRSAKTNTARRKANGTYIGKGNYHRHRSISKQTRNKRVGDVADIEANNRRREANKQARLEKSRAHWERIRQHILNDPEYTS